MPVCPICAHELQKPPKDVRDWFRCEKCGTPLQLHSSLSKMLYWSRIFGVLLVSSTFPLLVGKYLEGREFSAYLLACVLGATILALYAASARLLWNTRFSNPRPHDPYTSLNLSNGQTKFRGHLAEPHAHNPFLPFLARLHTSPYAHPCPACLRIFEPSEIQERKNGCCRCPACGEWLEPELPNILRVIVFSLLLALVLSWRLGYRGALFSLVLVVAFLFISVTVFFLCVILFSKGYKRAGD